MNPTLANTPKKYVLQYYLLKVRHGAIEIFLPRITVIKTSECWYCGKIKKSVEYLYIKYRKWKKKRRKLNRKLGKKDIRWQAQAKKKWLADLLGNKTVIVPLLRFLKLIDIERKKRARKKELK